MCRVLEVSKAGYYAWRSRKPSRRADRDRELTTQIRESFEASRGRYGAPRVLRDLKTAGIRCARKRVARLMRAAGLRGKTRRRFRLQAVAAYEEQLSENILDRRFGVDKPNQVWVADFTHISTRQGALYLAVVIDLYARLVVGWSMRNNPDRELALGAFDMALGRRSPAPGFIFHSDRGSQYTSRAFQEALRSAGAVSSMSKKGDCWDNAVVESFFASLKRELAGHVWATREEARAALFDFIEVWYNRQRRHSSLGYVPPHQFELETNAA